MARWRYGTTSGDSVKYVWSYISSGGPATAYVTSIPTYTGELASTKCQSVPDVQLGSQVEASGKAPQPPGIFQERYIHPPYKVAQTPHARLVFSLPQVLRRLPTAVSHFTVDGVQHS